MDGFWFWLTYPFHASWKIVWIIKIFFKISKGNHIFTIYWKDSCTKVKILSTFLLHIFVKAWMMSWLTHRDCDWTVFIQRFLVTYINCVFVSPSGFQFTYKKRLSECLYLFLIPPMRTDSWLAQWCAIGAGTSQLETLNWGGTLRKERSVCGYTMQT